MTSSHRAIRAITHCMRGGSAIMAWVLAASYMMPVASAAGYLREARTVQSPIVASPLSWEVFREQWTDSAGVDSRTLSIPGANTMTLSYLLTHYKAYMAVTQQWDDILRYANEHGISPAQARAQMPNKLVVYVEDVGSEAEAQAKIARASALVQEAIGEHYQHDPIPPLEQIVSAFIWGTPEQVTAQLSATHISPPPATTTPADSTTPSVPRPEAGGPDAVIGGLHGGLMSREEHEQQFNAHIAPVLVKLGEELQLPRLGGSGHPVFDFRAFVQSLKRRVVTKTGYLEIEPDGLLKILDTRFPFGHAGRNAFVVYAPTRELLTHEAVELHAWADFAVAMELVTWEQINDEHRLGDVIQTWLEEQAQSFPYRGLPIYDVSAYFHLLGLLAEGQVRNGRPIARPLLKDININWSAILLGNTGLGSPYRSWLQNVRPLLEEVISLWQRPVGMEHAIEQATTLVWLRTWEEELRHIPDVRRQMRNYFPESPAVPDAPIASSGPAAGRPSSYEQSLSLVQSERAHIAARREELIRLEAAGTDTFYLAQQLLESLPYLRYYVHVVETLPPSLLDKALTGAFGGGEPMLKVSVQPQGSSIPRFIIEVVRGTPGSQVLKAAEHATHRPSFLDPINQMFTPSIRDRHLSGGAPTPTPRPETDAADFGSDEWPPRAGLPPPGGAPAASQLAQGSLLAQADTSAITFVSITVREFTTLLDRVTAPKGSGEQVILHRGNGMEVWLDRAGVEQHRDAFLAGIRLLREAVEKSTGRVLEQHGASYTQLAGAETFYLDQRYALLTMAVGALLGVWDVRPGSDAQVEAAMAQHGVNDLLPMVSNVRIDQPRRTRTVVSRDVTTETLSPGVRSDLLLRAVAARQQKDIKHLLTEPFAASSRSFDETWRKLTANEVFATEQVTREQMAVGDVYCSVNWNTGLPRVDQLTGISQTHFTFTPLEDGGSVSIPTRDVNGDYSSSREPVQFRRLATAAQFSTLCRKLIAQALQTDALLQAQLRVVTKQGGSADQLRDTIRQRFPSYSPIWHEVTNMPAPTVHALLQAAHISPTLTDSVALPTPRPETDAADFGSDEWRPDLAGAVVATVETPRAAAQAVPKVVWIGEMPESLQGLEVAARVELKEGANGATALVAAKQWHTHHAPVAAGDSASVGAPPRSDKPDLLLTRPTVQVNPDWTLITIRPDPVPVEERTAAALASIAQVARKL